MKIKKLLLLFFLFIMIFNNLFAKDLNNLNLNKGFEKFKKQNEVFQTIGFGYTEKAIGLKYTINSSIIPFDFSKSNYFFTFEANDNRVEFYLEYNILGLLDDKLNSNISRYIKFSPGLGIGVDVKSAALSTLGTTTVNFAIPELAKNWSVSLSFKNFFSKEKKYKKEQATALKNGQIVPVTVLKCRNSDCTKTKKYFGIFLNYKF